MSGDKEATFLSSKVGAHPVPDDPLGWSMSLNGHMWSYRSGFPSHRLAGREFLWELEESGPPYSYEFAMCLLFFIDSFFWGIF